jgi:lincosamide nucleotidyltransferase B/F
LLPIPNTTTQDQTSAAGSNPAALLYIKRHMLPETYHQFTSDLLQNIAKSPTALGLVALGSMAQQDYAPDRFSDHDFFVVVQTGSQETWRNNLTWLPHSDQVALKLRETEHGLKILYQNGHLLEFAVFDLEELFMAKVNRFRVLLDRADVQDRLERIAAASIPSSQTHPDQLERLFGEFLCNVWVGVGRYQRGERFSAQLFVKSYALGHLLKLLSTLNFAPKQSLLDSLDASRRFERVFPELAAKLHAALEQDIPQAALELLALAREYVLPHLSLKMHPPLEVMERMVQSAI